MNWRAFQKHLPGGELPPYLNSLVRQPKHASRAAGTAVKDEFLRRFAGTAAQDRVALIENAIRAELIGVLELGANYELPVTQPWSELGIDSLMMVELKNPLEGALQVTLPVEKLARDMNTLAVAGFIAGTLADKVNDVASPAGNDSAISGAAEFERIYQLVAQIPQAFGTIPLPGNSATTLA